MSNVTDFFVKIDVSSDDPMEETEVREEIYSLLRKSKTLAACHVEVDAA